MKVLIVGAGVAGLAARAALEQVGIDTELIERSPRQRRGGYVLGLFPNGYRALRQIAACSAIHRVLEPVAEADVYVDTQRVWAQSPYIARDAQVWHVGRAELCDVLEAAVQSRPIEFGTTLAKINANAAAISVTFTTGEHRTYDLVIAADGRRSQLQRTVGGRTFVDTGFEYAFHWQPTRVRTLRAWIGPGGIRTQFPYRKRSGVLECRRRRPHRNSTPRPGRQQPNKHWVDDVESFPSRLVRGRLVLVGDAAHTLSPLSGMGANLALEGAVLLAQELATHATENSRALANYERAQLVRASRLRFAARFAYLASTNRWVSTSLGRVALRHVVLPAKRALARFSFTNREPRVSELARSRKLT